MRVLVAEADAAARGGAEAYAEAIRRVLGAMGHAVGHVDIRGHRPPGADVAMRLPVLPGRSLWNWAQVCRHLPRLVAGYDALVLAYGEGPALSLPTLTIRHAPALFSDQPELLGYLGARPTILRRSYVRLCRRVSSVTDRSGQPGRDHVLLANSRWTANRIARHFEDMCNHVLYPPLIRPAAPPAAVARQPFGLLALGRLVPNKRLEEAIGLTDKLRAGGLPATLRIVGRGKGRYVQHLQLICRARPHVTLVNDATEPERASELARATLGFHGYRGEHFGIAVAEMILSGVLPLVHDSGGVRELVTDPALRFRDPEDAARLAGRLLMRPDLVRSHLRDLSSGKALALALDFDRVAAGLLATWLAPQALSA